MNAYACEKCQTDVGSVRATDISAVSYGGMLSLTFCSQSFNVKYFFSVYFFNHDLFIFAF